MTDRIGKFSETIFMSLCEKNDAVCNPSTDDQHGWDFIVEIPAIADPKLPPDKQPQIIRILAQIKATKINSRSVRIKLSNALKMVESDLPCFLFLFWHNKYDCDTYKIFAIHVWQDLIERILKKARESEKIEPENLHKKYIHIRFGEEDEVNERDVVRWIKNTVGGIGRSYAEEKSYIYNNIGYENRKITGEFIIGPLQNVQEKIVEHEIGLLDSLPVREFTIFDDRFGIRSSRPKIYSDEGEIKIDLPELDEIIFRVTSQSGREIEIPATIRIPRIVPFNHRSFKMRIKAGFIDLTLPSIVSNSPKFRFNFDCFGDYSLYDHIRCYQFLNEIKRGKVNAEIMSSVGPLARYELDLKEGNYLGESKLSLLAKTLLDVAGDTLSIKILFSLNDISSALKEAYFISRLVQADSFGFRFVPKDPSKPPSIDILSGYFCFSVGQWCYSAIVEFKVVKFFKNDDVFVWDFSFDKFIQRRAMKCMIDVAKSEVENDFGKYLDQSKLRVMCIGSGELGDVQDQAGSVESILTNVSL